jgi:hypothetical protein
MGARLAITGAVELEPLELTVIEQGLADVSAAQGVLLALQTDELLRELASTPLMVNVLLLAHGRQDVPTVQVQTLEERRAVLWRAYVRRVLEHRPHQRSTQYLWDTSQILCCLHWLSLLLQHQSETSFLIDDLQPTMIPLKNRPWWYGGISGFIAGSGIGLRLGLFIGIFQGIGYGILKGIKYGLFIDLVWGAIFGLISGLLFGLFGALFGGLRIERKERLIWSWYSFRREFSKDGRTGLVVALFFALLGVVRIGFLGILAGLIFGILAWVSFGAYDGLYKGWQSSTLSFRILPMQGIYASFKIGVLHALNWFLISGLIGGWFGGLDFGLLFGSMFGLAFGLIFGLESFFQHYLLRFILSRAGLFPFRAITFLDAMAERLLLERDGAFYRFRHLLLRDFIADLSDDDIACLAREIDGSLWL